MGLQPFVGLTFVFFALFPLVLVLVPDELAGGRVRRLRAARDRRAGAQGDDHVAHPEEVRAQGVGLYWGVRSLAIAWAPLAGALLWQEGGPDVLLYAAFGFGVVGTIIYYVFCRVDEAMPRPV